MVLNGPWRKTGISKMEQVTQKREATTKLRLVKTNPLKSKLGSKLSQPKLCRCDAGAAVPVQRNVLYWSRGAAANVVCSTLP